MQITKDKQVNFAQVKKLGPQLVENIISNFATLNEKEIKQLKDLNLKETNNLPYAVLVDSGIHSTITKEAKELLASQNFSANIIANALLVRTQGHQMIGQFYLKLNKPTIPTKLFTERDKAIHWLNEMILLNSIQSN